jgi:hypothetical protein
MWQKLVENSLIGTAKLKLQKEELPDFLQLIISQSAFIEEEAILLQTASFANLYLEAGAIPPLYVGVMDDSKFAETKNYAPKNIMKLFDQIAGGSKYLDKEHILLLWVEKLLQKNWIVEADKINPLLELGNKFSPKNKDSIFEIVGNKGQWLLSIRKDLNYNQLNELQIWEEGDNTQRKKLFDDFRKKEPQKALELLEKTWQTESITNKRAFLESIDKTLQKVDFIFLENLWKYEFLAKPNEKETERQCRALVIKMLLKFPESEMFQLFVKSISPYFQKKKKGGKLGFVTGKEEIFIALPNDEDAFWSKTNMLNTFAFETNAGQTAIFPTLATFWLFCLVEITPFQYWINNLSKNITETLNYFLREDQFIITVEGQKQSVLLQPILENAQNTQNQEAIETLLHMLAKNDGYSILPFASLNIFEQYIAKNKLWTDAQAICTRTNIEEKWSASFSKELLLKIYEESAKNNIYLSDIITKTASKAIDYQCLNYLKDVDAEAGDYYVKHYNKVFYEPMAQLKDIISKIENYS